MKKEKALKNFVKTQTRRADTLIFSAVRHGVMAPTALRATEQSRRSILLHANADLCDIRWPTTRQTLRWRSQYMTKRCVRGRAMSKYASCELGIPITGATAETSGL